MKIPGWILLVPRLPWKEFSKLEVCRPGVLVRFQLPLWNDEEDLSEEVLKWRKDNEPGETAVIGDAFPSGLHGTCGCCGSDFDRRIVDAYRDLLPESGE